jgi:mono/diheme cytochrome c family protein
MRPTLILAAMLLFCLACTAQTQKPAAGPDREAQTRIPLNGAQIFQHQCASCHGTDGRGHGPASATLKHKPANLTLISQTNGGEFPYQRVKETIAGKESSWLALGTREMPIYGPIFHQVESDQDWGEVRLEAITKQVESIQQK